jgi:hypothetical protein
MTEGNSNMICRLIAVTIAVVSTATPLFGQSAVPPPTEMTVKTAPADVHISPTVASPVLGTAPAGTVLEIRRNLGSWVEVPWQGADAGLAFVHVTSGTIAPRTTPVATGTARDAAAEIAAVAAAAAAATSSARSGVSNGDVRSATRRDNYVALPPHHIGVGATMDRVDVSMPAFGATARTWWASGLGVQFNLSRPRLEAADGRSLRSTQFAPSVLYSLPDAVTTSVWLRPYAGAGPRIYRAHLETHLGYEAFGGAEATLAAMPQLALSTDIGYRWSRPTINGFEPRDIGFSLLAHWYVK